MRPEQLLVVGTILSSAFILDKTTSMAMGTKSADEKLQSSHRKDYDFTCETCKVFMIVVKDQVANPNNEQAVADFLKQFCATIFPDDQHMQGECKVLIDEYTDDIIELLINEILDPQTVCEIMGLCKAPTVSSKPVKSLIFEDRSKFSICDSCKDLVNVLRNSLTDPANENFVANSLRKICVVIFPNDPTNFANCDTMIAEYTDDIIELLVNEYLDPTQFCQSLFLCPSF